MYKKTSLLDGFELPNITHENIKQQLIKLGNSHLVRQRKSIDGLPIEERLKVISDEVMKILSRYKDFVRVIYDENELNQYIDYVISKGDTLWNLAKKYSTTVAELVTMNNIDNPDVIIEGEKLIIPGRAKF